MVGLIIKWFDYSVLLDRQWPSPTFHYYMVIGKEENENFRI